MHIIESNTNTYTNTLEINYFDYVNYIGYLFFLYCFFAYTPALKYIETEIKKYSRDVENKTHYIVTGKWLYNADLSELLETEEEREKEEEKEKKEREREEKETKDKMDKIVADLQGSRYSIKDIEQKTLKRTPSPPFPSKAELSFAFRG
jgi:GTPase involved in cell partitioning and DNA repair